MSDATRRSQFLDEARILEAVEATPQDDEVAAGRLLELVSAQDEDGTLRAALAEAGALAIIRLVRP